MSWIGLGLDLVTAVGGGAAAPAKTYAEFQAHITSLATSGTVAWSSGAVVAGSFKTTAGADAGFLYGTPWNASFTSSNASKVVQHGLPSQAEYLAQIAAARDIFIRVNAISGTNVSGINRNGFTSANSVDAGAGVTNRTCDLLLFWNATLGKAQQMNPFAGTGPVDYTW